MKKLILLSVLMSSAVFAETGVRISLENVLTGPAVGTANLYAIQLEMDFVTLGPVELGLSLRKEGRGSVDGYGFGVHVSRNWRPKKRIGFVTQAGVRVLIPGVEYNRFRLATRDGEMIWQRWDRISTNLNIPIGSGTANVGGSASWAPNFGFFAEYGIGPVRVRAGIRATVHRYGTEILHRPPGGQLNLLRNDRSWKVIFAPTITIGF